MQDRPNPIELVKAVTNLLQTSVLPQSSGRLGFEIRVAINALELVARQLTQAEHGHADELHRLADLLGHEGSLTDLNRELCACIASGAFDGNDEELVSHLWATTMEKLAVDQPSYAAFRDEQQKQAKG
jgi:Domain of unknown function (DUF6285)